MTRHKRKIKLKSVYQWHRYVGITIALFVILLAITGIALNHTTELKLGKSYVNNKLLLNHYGIHAPEKITSYNKGSVWVSQWHKRLYLNEQDLGESSSQLVGVAVYEDIIIIAMNNYLLLYTTEGELIEKLGSIDKVPAAISKIGITDNNELAVMAASGTYTTDKDFSIWLNNSQAVTVWNDTQPLPADLKQRLVTKYLGKGLTIERLILDLHSGRLLNLTGVYFMDFVALLLVFLAGSGLWIWTIRQIKQHKHHKNQHILRYRKRA